MNEIDTKDNMKQLFFNFGGIKNDTGKLRYDLIPTESEEGLAQVYTYGAGKYDDRNWEKGIKYSRVYAAIRRHLAKFWSGEDLDKESGFSHLSHAAWGCFSLETYRKRGMTEFDDRPKTNKHQGM